MNFSIPQAAHLFRHDVRPRDDDDTFVVDAADLPGDLEVQVKLTRTGCWHRKAIDGLTTACGESLGGYATRPEQYGGLMCIDGCYSTFELGKAAEAAKIAAVAMIAAVSDMPNKK